MKQRKIVITENALFYYVLPLHAFEEDEILEFNENIQDRFRITSKHVVLDLLNIDYLYSNGINSFIRCYKTLHKSNKEMVILNASDLVGYVLKSVSLNKIIPLLNSFDAFYQWQSRKSGIAPKSGFSNFKVEQRGKIAVITPDKAGNSHSSIELRPDFQKVKDIIISPMVIMELSRLFDYNSVMLSSLVSFARDLKEKRGKLVLSGLDDASKELFELLDIDRHFEYAANLDNAMDFFS